MKGLQWPSCRCSSWNRRFLSSCSKWATGPLRWADNGWRSCQSEERRRWCRYTSHINGSGLKKKTKWCAGPPQRKTPLNSGGTTTLRQFSHTFQIRTYHGLRWKPSGCVRLRFCGVVWKALASALNREGLCPVSLERDQHHWVPQANSQAKQLKYLSWAKVVWSFAELIFWTKWCKVSINQSNTKSLATLPSTPQKQVNVILKLCIMTIHFFGGGLMILSSNKKNIAYSFPPSNKTAKHPFLTQSKQIPKSSPCPKKTEHITYPKTPKGPANGSVFTRFLQGCFGA